MPALYFRATRDTKSFFVAQPVFLSINIIEEVLRVLLSTSLPVLSCDPKVEQEVKKCSPFTQKIRRFTMKWKPMKILWIYSWYIHRVFTCFSWHFHGLIPQVFHGLDTMKNLLKCHENPLNIAYFRAHENSHHVVKPMK